MIIIEEEQDNLIILRLEGRLDANSSPQVEKRINTFVETHHLNLIMNCENVSYLSSAGMRLLLSATKKFKSVGGKFILCCLSEDVMEIITMTGFQHILHLEDSEEKSIQIVKQL